MGSVCLVVFSVSLSIKGGWLMGKGKNEQISVSKEIVVQPLLLTIPQVMRCMGLGRNKVYDLIQKEDLPVLRFGRAVRVSYIALQQWIERREQGVVGSL